MTTRKLAAALCLILVGAIGLHGQTTGTISPLPYQTVMDANGATISGACVWTYTAGTSAAATTYTDKALAAPNANPVIANSSGQLTMFLVPGSSYKFIYEGPCTPPAHGTTIRTQDNVDAVPASSAAIDQTGTAAEPITAGQVVYLSDGSDGRTAGQWYVADSTFNFLRTQQMIGVALMTNLVGPTGGVSFRIFGTATNQSGLTVGKDYYVGTSGTVTITPSVNSRYVGQAISSTSLLLAANPPSPGVRLVNKDVNTVLVNNTAVASNVYLVSVPGGTLGTDRILRLTLDGTYQNTSGGASNFTVAVTYGATTLVGGLAVAYATATLGAVHLVMDIVSNAGVQNVVTMMNVPVSATSNAGAVWNAHSTLGSYLLNALEDTSTAHNLTVTVTHSVANANISFTKYGAMVEVLGQLP